MAEGFAQALGEITYELSNVKDLHALYDTEEMDTVVIQLYSHVMHFLCFSMKWCMKFGSIGKFPLLFPTNSLTSFHAVIYFRR
jgi:hypothetical protein